MSLLIALLIGAFVGVFTDWLIHGGFYDAFLNSLLGIIGSIVGLAVYFFVLASAQTSIGLFSLPSALCSVIFALIICLTVNGLQAIAPKRVAQSHVEQDPIDEEENQDQI
jgi:uncharacterized membrane protein YeaQ/YmgE (transglycosylase-associated protein family)